MPRSFWSGIGLSEAYGLWEGSQNVKKLSRLLLSIPHTQYIQASGPWGCTVNFILQRSQHESSGPQEPWSSGSVVQVKGISRTQCGSASVASVAQLVGHHPANWKVTGSIPSQGTCRGVGSIPGQGACKRQLINVSLFHWWFSPSLSPSLPLCLE